MPSKSERRKWLEAIIGPEEEARHRAAFAAMGRGELPNGYCPQCRGEGGLTSKSLPGPWLHHELKGYGEQIVCGICRGSGNSQERQKQIMDRFHEIRKTIRMAKFRKKPVVIDAVLWDGTNFDLIREFANRGQSGVQVRYDEGNLIIDTLEGKMTALPGDMIIRGVKGEYYPCKPDIFQATYDAVEEPGSTMGVPDSVIDNPCSDDFK
jgi:hypothetical protein